MILCSQIDLKLQASVFHVDYVLRFEGISNPGDSSIVYALSGPNGMKGILLDAFGVYADSINQEILSKLRIDKTTQRRLD